MILVKKSTVCSECHIYTDCGTDSQCLCVFTCQVLRAQNLVAAEAAQSGPGQPGEVCPPGRIFTSREEMALPKGLLCSAPSSLSTKSARQKIQAKIDSEWFIKPTPKDTTRFQPKQVCFKL